MGVLVQIVVWLNAAANAVGQGALAPIAVLPGWLSATLIAAVTGVLLLVVFKYTSNQRAIKRARDAINANLLALKLFKESPAVAVRAQGRILQGAARLFVLALAPMLVMAVPVILILGQLSLWYQQRPLAVGEEAVVTMKLNGDVDAPFPEVTLQPLNAAETTVGPVHVQGEREREIRWKIKARETGVHRVQFQASEQALDKELTIGDGFLRVSAQRPGWHLDDILKYPWEKPFNPDSPVRSIEIDYPERSSWTSGTDWWVAYWFGMSMVAGFCLRGLLKVNV